jgi:hypothetical protein
MVHSLRGLELGGYWNNFALAVDIILDMASYVLPRN